MNRVKSQESLHFFHEGFVSITLHRTRTRSSTNHRSNTLLCAQRSTSRYLHLDLRHLWLIPTNPETCWEELCHLGLHVPQLRLCRYHYTTAACVCRFVSSWRGTQNCLGLDVRPVGVWRYQRLWKHPRSMGWSSGWRHAWRGSRGNPHSRSELLSEHWWGSSRRRGWYSH